MAKKHRKIITVEKCCNQDYLKVGYIFKRKNEVYICPVCGRIFHSKRYGKIKTWWINLFKHMYVYDDRQVRLYWVLDKPMVIADNTGETISNIERGLEEVRKNF